LQQHGLSFDHNLHALRIVERFEQRYAGHRGLNLTLGAREGIVKHSRDYAVEEHPDLAQYFPGQKPPIEAQLIDLADEIAYLTADLDDGVESGLLEIGHIRENVEILRHSYLAVERVHPQAEEKYIFHDALQAMQKTLILDLIRNTAANVERAGAKSLRDIRALDQRVAVLSPSAEALRRQGKSYLYETLYTCPALELEHSKAEAVIREIFAFWINFPEEMPESYAEDVRTDGLARVVADYIAGMTDNFILLQYAEVRRKIRQG
jgi:dGTPase